MNKNSFLASITNNGLMSNLMYGAIISAFVAAIRFMVGKIVDDPAMQDSATIIAAILAFVIAWFFHWRTHSGEKFWMKECNFSLPPQSRINDDKYFVDKFEVGESNERQVLQSWLEKWVASCGMSESDRGSAAICIIEGSKKAGRTSIVMHVGLRNLGNKKATPVTIYFSTGFSQQHGQPEEMAREEWRSSLVRWVASTDKRRMYMLLISARNIGIEDIVVARDKARHLNKKICFILKDPIPHVLCEAEPRLEDARFSISELTPEECQRFLYKYASKTWRLEEYAEMKDVYKKREGKENFGNWFRNCSGGHPSRLIHFFEYNGRSFFQIVAEFLSEFMALTGTNAIGETELSFLWCLCVEKRRVEMHNPNGIVDLNKICKRLNCLGGNVPTELVCKLFNIKEFTGSVSVSVLEGRFANAIEQIPQEMFIASLGYWNDRPGCQCGIAEWIKSVLKEDGDGEETQEYVETISNATFEALMCTGFLGNPNQDEDFKEYLRAIECLAQHVGSTGKKDFDDKVEKFIRTLINQFTQKVVESCLDGIGFGDDANIVAIMSAVLKMCKDRQRFLDYYSLAIPLFGLLVCDPFSISSVKDFIKILYEAETDGCTDGCDTDTIYVLLQETYFLCKIRINYAKSECIRMFIDDPRNILSQTVKSRAANGDRVANSLLILTKYFEGHDATSFASELKKLLKLIPETKWDGLKILISMALVYISGPNAVIDDKLLRMLMAEVEKCRFAFDVENKIATTTYFSLMMRRAFYKYRDTDYFDPWVIDWGEDEDEQGGERTRSIVVRFGAARGRKQRVSGMKSNDLLRNLPVIVRQFAECTCLKKRGLAEYEEVLEADWKKINKIVTNEKWFDSINRRSRYWILFWSSFVVRDVMDVAEQRKFLDRVMIMCEEVASKLGMDNVWYRLLTLRTLENVIKDKPLLNKKAGEIYKFLIEDYRDLIDGECEYELRAWYRCAMEFFHDYLGVVSIEYEPIDVFKSMLVTLWGCQIENNADIIAEYLKFHVDKQTLVDNAFVDMLLNIWNMDCDRKISPDSTSRDFVNVCFDGDLMVQLKDELIRCPNERTAYLKLNFLNIVPMIVALRMSWSGCLEGKGMEFVVECMSQCKNLLDYRKLDVRLHRIMRIGNRMGLKDNEFLESCKAFCDKWDRLGAEDLMTQIKWECDNAVDEQELLGTLWSAPIQYFRLLKADDIKKISDHLESILDRFSSKWKEGFRSDWYEVVTVLILADRLGRCSEGFLTKIEKLYFSGELKKFCPKVRSEKYFLVDVLLALAESRNLRKGTTMTHLKKEYSVALSELKTMLGADDLEGMRGLVKGDSLGAKLIRIDDLLRNWSVG